MSGYAEYSNHLLNQYPNTHKVPLVKATMENFKKYGKFVYDYDNEKVKLVTWPAQGFRPIMYGTGFGGGITEGKFVYSWDNSVLRAINNAVGGNYITGILPLNNIGVVKSDVAESVDDSTKNRKVILTREANYHPDGGQVFFPLVPTPFILLLALPGDDIKLEDFVGFYFDGTYGIQIYPNIWHQPIFPISGFAQFKTKQGAVHACVKVDTLLDFETWLEISLEIKNN